LIVNQTAVELAVEPDGRVTKDFNNRQWNLYKTQEGSMQM